MTPRYHAIAATLLSALLAAACSSGSGANLSVSAKTATSTSAPSAAASTSLDLGNGIVIDRIRVVIRKLKLEGAAAAADGGMVAGVAAEHSSGGGSSGSSSGGGSDDGKTEVEHESDDPGEVVLGPVLVDVSGTALAAGLQQVFAGLVPEGSFREIKFAVGPVDASQAGADAGLAAMAAQHASLVIDGTVDGKAFSFVSTLTAQFQFEGDIVVSAGKSNNVTVSLDPQRWFGGSGAARLDPSVTANQPAIESNIEAAIQAFEDDDRHGDDDHGSQGGHG